MAKFRKRCSCGKFPLPQGDYCEPDSYRVKGLVEVSYSHRTHQQRNL